MLDAFIIEEIKRRERLRQEQDRPVAELPVPSPDDRPKRRSDHETNEEDGGEEAPRGVVIIDMSV